MANELWCTIHSQPMKWGESKTKFDNEGNPKKYKFHLDLNNKMCFGESQKKNDNPSSPQKFEKSMNSYGDDIPGKVRSMFLQAHIQKNGLVGLSVEEDAILDVLVERAMGDRK